MRTDGGPLALGKKARVTPKGFISAIWTVTAFEEGRLFTWEAAMLPGVHLVAEHQLEPDAGGTRLTLALRSSGPMALLMTPMLAMIFRRNTRVEGEGMKAYCEGKT